MIQRRFFVSGAMALLLGAVVAVVFRPSVERGRLVNDATGVDATARAFALERLTHSHPGSPPRVVEDDALRGRIVDALKVVPDEVFIEVADALRSTGAWRVDETGTELWIRRISLVLDRGGVEAFDSVLTDLARVKDDEATVPLYVRLISSAPDDERRAKAFRSSLRNGAAGGREVMIESALQHPSARLRRLGWLAVGLLRPDAGFAANWLEEEATVAEAILWAVARTASEPSIILDRAFALRPDATGAWPLLRCAHLNADEAIGCRLRQIINESESVDRRALAWFGGAGPTSDAIASRWAAWRALTPAPDDAILKLVDPPVAEDASVWAAAMLAHRQLSSDASRELRRQWIDSLERETRRAGVLLAALAGDADLIRSFAAVTAEERTHRMARVAYAISEPDSNAPARREARLLAWRIYSDEPPGPRSDLLLLLFLLDDSMALETVLASTDSASIHDAMLRYAWMIEQTRPELIEVTGPLDPWNADAASLQRDILLVADSILPSEEE